MKILIVEPFFSGSHKKWASSYQHSSQHNVEILSLPGHHWKWRMYGGAVNLSKSYKKLNFRPDLIIASDMLDLATFTALVRHEIKGIPIVLYFHENQITYPWSPDDRDTELQRDNHYGFINYTSALCADYIFYNSRFHMESFVGSLNRFLKQFPDYQDLQNINAIRDKSNVLYLGMNLKAFNQYTKKKENKIPILLWNHRWEYDKNPEGFYQVLLFLKEERLNFNLILLGQSYQKTPLVFDQIKKNFKKEILHIGYAEDFESYASLLWKADFLPVSNIQDFFGGSIIEAIYCQCHPLLPDRLAYPEHIPLALREKYLYQTESELKQKLKQAIIAFNSKESNQSLANFVARYDWSNLAGHYDKTFEKIVDEYHAF